VQRPFVLVRSDTFNTHRKIKKMAWSSVARFSDPVDCQRSIQGAAGLEIFPTTRGNFATEVTKIRFDRLWMQRFHSSLPQIISCEHLSDRQAISFLTEVNSPSLFYCGREVLPGDVVVSRRALMHKRFDADVRKGAMSLPKNELNSAFKAVNGYEFCERHDMCLVRPDATLMSRLLMLHRSVGQLAHNVPDVLEQPEVDRALEQELIHLMARCLADREASKTGGRQSVTMMRFEEFLEANPDRPIYLVEICAALAVSERTLRGYCEEHLGMGPIRYLALRRMHLVRRELMRADPSETTVTKIATDHGFWELGRFSVTYGALFGEAPSRTLHRSIEHAAMNLDRPSSLGETRSSTRLN
jgi:AraC-like DNA-binding protein